MSARLRAKRRFERWSAASADNAQIGNATLAIRRLRRRLLNSMAHTPRPRPADVERWRQLEAEIAEREAWLAEARLARMANRKERGDAKA